MTAEKESLAYTKFFFFAFLDEESALRASVETRSATLSKTSSAANIWPSLAVAEKIATRYLLTQQTQFKVTYHNGWESALPIHVDSWLSFKRVATFEELFAWIWVELVGLDRVVVSRSLGLSEGTLLSRLESGLRKFSNLQKRVL